MRRYCDFEAALGLVARLVQELLRERFNDMPLQEQETVREIAFRDFVHYLANKAGVYSRRRFRENEAREKLCRFIERNWDAVVKTANSWFYLWTLKWSQRVKLVFSDEEFKRMSQSAKWNSQLESFLRKINLLDLKLFTISNLIRSGELAGLDQMSEYIIRDEINALLERHGIEKALEKYKSGELTSRILKRIHDLKNSNDYVLILKVDFYRAYNKL